MSVNLGFYDFFSYIIPGLLYLYVINDLLRVLGAKFIDIESWLRAGQAPDLVVFLPILLAAYVIGYVFDAIALRFFFRFLYRLFEKESATTKSLNVIKDRYPELQINFKPKDWEVLFVIIRQRNGETAQNIDRFQANSIMLRNISLGLLLAALLNVAVCLSSKSWSSLAVAVGELLVCGVSISESFKFRTWFFTNIFAASLQYGLSVEEVISGKTQQ